MASVNELYQEIIIEHGSSPRNEGALENATHHAQGYNATCGDELSVSIRVESGQIAAVKFQSQGCTIARASGSMMTEKIKGMSVDQAIDFSKKIQKILNCDTSELIDPDTLGDLVALLGVKQFPMRVKCATLAWHTLDHAMEK